MCMKKFVMENFRPTIMICILIFVISFAAQSVRIMDGEYAQGNQTFAVGINLVDISSTNGRASGISFSATENVASVQFSLPNFGDSITYRIRIINSGTTSATLNNISIKGLSGFVDYDIIGAVIGSKLNSGDNNTFFITFKYDEESSAEIMERITIEFEYK